MYDIKVGIPQESFLLFTVEQFVRVVDVNEPKQKIL